MESRWRNSHGLVYHGPVTNRHRTWEWLAPSTFTMVYRYDTVATSEDILLEPWATFPWNQRNVIHPQLSLSLSLSLSKYTCIYNKKYMFCRQACTNQTYKNQIHCQWTKLGTSGYDSYEQFQLVHATPFRLLHSKNM